MVWGCLEFGSLFCGIWYCCAFTESLNATAEGLERVQHVDYYRTVSGVTCCISRQAEGGRQSIAI